MEEKKLQELHYLIALSKTKYIGPIIARHILDNLDDISILFDKDKREESKIYNSLHNKIKESLNNTNLDESKRILEDSLNNNIQIISIKDTKYPKLLKECADAPIILYQKGELRKDAFGDSLSIVGTRNMSIYGADMIKKILLGISEAIPNMPIVSGLAYGVDIEAHRLSLEYNMPNIAVLAHGLDTVYPYQHRKYTEKIVKEGGILVSEYPIGTKATRFNFVARNRIIAGISKACVVIEAGIRSGSLSTARLAIDYDRELFALPGRVSDKFSEGTNTLIKEMKAQLLTSSDDILKTFSFSRVDKNILSIDIPLEFEKDIDNPIYNIIKEKQPIQINDLLVISGENMQSLSNKLFELEIDGYISSMPGGLYICNK